MKLAGICLALAFAVAAAAAGASAAHQLPGPAHAAKVGCKLSAAAPTVANDQVTGTGSIRCKRSRTVHVHLETQVLANGEWESFGSLDNTSVRVRAGRTRQLSTGPANCKGLGQLQMRTVLKLVRFPRTLAEATSATVDIACSSHP